jgi:hypothetical protein
MAIYSWLLNISETYGGSYHKVMPLFPFIPHLFMLVGQGWDYVAIICFIGVIFEVLQASFVW